MARSSRLGHSGSNSPGRRYESSRHGLAASRPRTPGSGAVRFHSPPTKPSSRLGTRHIVRCNAVVRSAPLPVRHPGPRVTAAGRYTPAPSGLATTAAQSGQRHASYHPPRPIMSAARDKMLSTPCRARLRAARHYRTSATERHAQKPTSAASGRRAVVTALRVRLPLRREPPCRGSRLPARRRAQLHPVVGRTETDSDRVASTPKRNASPGVYPTPRRETHSAHSPRLPPAGCLKSCNWSLPIHT